MVLTTDDSLEAILAETVAAAEQCLRDMKGEAAPPPPPPPAPSLKPWCGACELTGDGLRVAAGCAVAKGSVAFYDADQKADEPVLSVACDAVAASYALGTDGVTFRADELTYTVRFEDPGDVAGFCRAVASTARATRIFELRASADERVVQREDLCEVSIKVYRGDALVRDDPDAACAADGSIEPVPGIGARVVGARRGSAIGMLMGDRWVEAVIGHIAGGDVVEDPPLLEKEVIEERVVTPPPKIRPVSLEKARRQLDDLLLRAKEEPGEDPRVAELLKERDVLRSKLRGNEDALEKLRAFMEKLKKPRRVKEPPIPPAARAWKAEVDAEVACSKAAMAAEQARLAARNASVWAAVPVPREIPPVNGPIADALLRSVAFDLEVLERRGSAADHARYLDGLRAVLRREEGRRDLF